MDSGSDRKALLLVLAAVGFTALAVYSPHGQKNQIRTLVGAPLVAQSRPRQQCVAAPVAPAEALPAKGPSRAGSYITPAAPAPESPIPEKGQSAPTANPTPASRFVTMGSGPAASSSARYSPAAPSAGPSRFAPVAGARAAPAQARIAGVPPPRSASAGPEAHAAGASKDDPLASNMAGALNAARDLKIAGGSDQAASDPPHLAAAILQQIDTDNKVDEGVRGALAKLQASGQPATPAAMRQAAASVLAADGQSADDEDADTAVARATRPHHRGVPPGAYAQAAQAVVADPPDPQTSADIMQHADDPPPEQANPAPPPHGALEAYQQNRAVFDRALKEYGVQPQDILGILGVETGWGQNTGDHPLNATLITLAGQIGPDGKPTSRAVQAQHDLAALTRLTAQGDLGDLKPTQVRGSWAGAMGVPQFLPSSWDAYGRSADGSSRDPFSLPDSILSVANYLNRHGYSSDVAGSIYGYNHSQQYVNKVQSLSAQIKAGLH
jgi:membrane-bound lytic murein transglycosylase B